MQRVRELFEGIPAESIAYLNHPVVYDARRTVDLLAPHGLVPPKFGEYAPAMVDFFREHEDDPALRPKPPARLGGLDQARDLAAVLREVDPPPSALAEAGELRPGGADGAVVDRGRRLDCGTKLRSQPRQKSP